MKKRFSAIILALALTIGLTIPAFAASEALSGGPDINISLPDERRVDPITSTYQLRPVSATALTDKETNTSLGYMITRSTKAEKFNLTTFTLPLGATITISNLRNDWSANGGVTDVLGIQAYSDPDGDGVYDQWIYNFENTPPVLPLSEPMIAFPPTENGKYSYAAYITKDNNVGLDTTVLPNSVKISTDYLSQVFGPNTLVLIQLQTWTAISTNPLTAFQTGSNGTYAFLITGEKAADAPATPNAPGTPEVSTPAFTDVAKDAYYAAPVAWAVSNEITTGTGNNKFSPDQDCTNAQILTFIWRAYDKPEPTIDNPFTNSIPEAYLKAAIWAYEKGMVSGASFDANKPCTRAMAATYLWQAAGSPTAPAANFTDVPADAAYAPAVAWAVEQKITTGTGTGTTFSPDDVCSRGQIVTFLYRAFAANTSEAVAKASKDVPEVDFSAEYMSSPYYKALQEVVLTGDYRKDILAVASSQIGYSEGDKEDQLDGSYHGSGDYTEYGRYLGSNGSAWCSEFASWCARVAKVPASILNSSRGANVKKFGAPYYTWSQTVYAGGTYTPRPGDLALFAWTGTSTTTEESLSHTAIVYDVQTNGNKVEITLIHGNSGNTVRKNTIIADASTGEVRNGHLVCFVAPEYES